MNPFSKATTASLVVLMVVGCAGGVPTASHGTGRLILQLATLGRAASGSGGAPAAVTVKKGTDEVVITQVQFVARKLKLESVEGICPAPVLTESDNGGTSEAEGENNDVEEDSDVEDSEDCPNVKLGPLLLDPPLTEGAETSFSADVPAGSYRQLELQIHKVTDRPGDAAFLAAHPGFAGISMKITGTFNGAPFTFTTDLTTEVEVEFATAIEVTAAGTTKLTLLLDVRGWFLDQSGAALLNPGVLTDQSRLRIEQNIRGSFNGFEDENSDGNDDHNDVDHEG